MEVRKILLKLTLILVLMSIVACGTKEVSKPEVSRPDDIRESIWYNGKELYLELKNAMSIAVEDFDNEDAFISREVRLKLKSFEEEFADAVLGMSMEYTPSESKIIAGIYFIHLNYLNYFDNILKGDEEEAKVNLENFNSLVSDMEEIFGE